MLTILLSDNHTAESLEFTLKSILQSKADLSMLEIKILRYVENNKDDCGSVFSGFDTEIIEGSKKKKAELLNVALKKAKSDYVIFANSGDVFLPQFFNAFTKYAQNADANGNSCFDVALFGTQAVEYAELGTALKTAKKQKVTATMQIVDLNMSPELVPIDLCGVVFRKNALLTSEIDFSLGNNTFKYAMYSIINKSESVAYFSDIFIYSAYPRITNKVNFPGMHKKKWYYDELEGYVLRILKSFRNNEKAKVFIQYAALNELRWRFIYNHNSDNKHIVDNEFDRFMDICRSILSEIDNNVIFNSRNGSGYNMIKGLCFAMFNIKYGIDYKSNYIYDNNNILREYENIIMMRAGALRVILELLEYDKKNDTLRIEASVDDFMDMSKCRLKCVLDGKEIEIEPTYRYAHTKYFGVSVNRRYTFRVIVPVSSLSASGNSELNFYVGYDDFFVQIPFVTRRYTSKISADVPYSYWKFGDDNRAVSFENNKKTLTFSFIKGFGRFKRELKMLVNMLHGPKRSYKMFLVRICYWLSRPYFRNKRIWLTYDKLYKGGDCGEYFYKYMLAQKDGIISDYVINKDCEDAKRLRKEGYKPLYFGTMKNILHYLNAEVVFATHGGTHSFNGLPNSYVKYVSDLIHSDVTCIQHGLSVQQLAQELNMLYNNTKRYYCASKYEIKNLEHPIYGYEDKSVFRLTGIPRYDGLVSNDKKQILITPTWRAYISMPPVMGQSRPYYPEFKHTNYYKIYYKLLTDSKLIETARRTGYKLIYLLHPIISSQIVDYPDIDGVEIIPATTVNYEKILTESSLMLTDYSGVQFDFAYMRKPVVYYHPPKLPPHYKEGGFFYDSMGFGEICTEHQQMVDCLCEYMENNCEMKPFYKDRADDFFAFSDHDTCKRIYDDITEYMNNKD